MPLVRIDVSKGKPIDHRRAIGDVVYEAMRAVIAVPENDRFQIIVEHDGVDLICDPTFMGITRSQDCVLIQITLSEGRTSEMKQAFYGAIADGLPPASDIGVAANEMDQEPVGRRAAVDARPHGGRCEIRRKARIFGLCGG